MTIKLPVKRGSWSCCSACLKTTPKKCSVSSFLLAASIARDVCCPAHKHAVCWKRMGFQPACTLEGFSGFQNLLWKILYLLEPSLFPFVRRLQSFLIPKMHLCCVRNACDERAYSCRGIVGEAGEYIAILHFINSAPFFKSLLEPSGGKRGRP